MIKQIDGYENYAVDDEGNVWNTKTEKKLKPWKSKDGYLYVKLMKYYKYKVFTVHRLVATYFIPNPNRFSEINHIDEIKDNNSVIWEKRRESIN